MAQAAQVEAYRERFAALQAAGEHVGRTPKVAVGRIVVPLLDEHDRQVHEEFLTGYASGMDDEGRPLSGNPPFRFSKVVAGEPAAIVDALRADPAVSATDELVITLPANGDAGVARADPDRHRRGDRPARARLTARWGIRRRPTRDGEVRWPHAG